MVIVLGVLCVATCLFYYEVVFLGRTLVPLGVPRTLPSGPYGASVEPRPDPFRLDRGASAWQSEPMAAKVIPSARSWAV